MGAAGVDGSAPLSPVPCPERVLGGGLRGGAELEEEPGSLLSALPALPGAERVQPESFPAGPLLRLTSPGCAANSPGEC